MLPRLDLLVVGGTGLLGGGVCQLAVSLGLRVGSLSRSGVPFTSPMLGATDLDWKAHTRWRVADVSAPGPRALPADCHARAVLFVATQYWSRHEGERLAQGAFELASHARALGASRFTYVDCASASSALVPAVRAQHAAARRLLPALDARPHAPEYSVVALPHVVTWQRWWTPGLGLWERLRGRDCMSAAAAAAALLRVALDGDSGRLVAGDDVFCAAADAQLWVEEWVRRRRAGEVHTGGAQ